MRHFNLTYSILFLSISVLIVPAVTHAQDPNAFVTLVPQLPLLGTQTSVPELLNALFGITVAVAAMLAVIMFVVGGFQYMASEALNSKGEAKSRMQQAILGLLIVLTAVLVLNTINPDITMLNIFRSVPENARPPDASVNAGTQFEKTVDCTPPDTPSVCCAAAAGKYTVAYSEWANPAQTKARCVFNK